MFPFSSIEHYHSDLHNGRTTCEQAVRHFLSRIDETAPLNAFVEVFAEEALSRAQELDRSEPTGNLYGVIIGIKDNICYKGHKVSAGSGILQNFTSLYSATAVERLLQEGAIIIGRQNCDEFGMGSTNENSFYGPSKNPIDPERVPGGSSGGSAAAVKAGLCMAALGSDTGGSVRLPADFCGIVGLKPSYGRVSRHGLIAYASSFDVMVYWPIQWQMQPQCWRLLQGRMNTTALLSAVKWMLPPLQNQTKNTALLISPNG